MKLREIILLAAIAMFAFLLRFYDLGVYPAGLYWDEASSGYNAYSILKTGRDEFGNLFPAYFPAFGEYKLPGLIYSMSLSMAIFGLNNFALRAPSAVSGVLTVILVFYLLRLSTAGSLIKKRLSYLASFFLASLPWHIHFSRAGFDATIGLFFVTLGVYLWFTALKKGRSLILFLSLVAFICSVYSYNAERLFVPLFLIFIILSSWKKLNLPLKNFLIILVICYLISFPFLKFIFSYEGMIRASSESFINDVNIPATSSMLQGLIAYLKAFAANYASHFSFDYLFFTGDQSGRHSVREMGMIYVWQLPFVLLGLWVSIKNRSDIGKIALAWIVIGALPASLAKASPHALRSLLMVVPLAIFISYGVGWLLIRLPKLIFYPFMVCVVCYGLFTYLHLYYIHYVKRSAFDWQDGYEKMVYEVKKNIDDVDRVIITKEYGYPYVYVLLYLPYDPKRYIAEKGNANGFGKFSFISSPYPGKLPPKTLYVAAPWEEPNGENISNISMINGDVHFRLWKN